jgi:hypothetical protein
VENGVDYRCGIAGEPRRAKDRNTHAPAFRFCGDIRRVGVDEDSRVAKSGKPPKATRSFDRSRDETGAACWQQVLSWELL